MDTPDLPLDVATIFQDFERYLDAHRRADPGERAIDQHGNDPLAAGLNALLLQWLDHALDHTVLTRAEYRAAIAEYDRRRAAEAAARERAEAFDTNDRDKWIAWAGEAGARKFAAWFDEHRAEYGNDDEQAFDVWQERQQQAARTAAAEAQRLEAERKAQEDKRLADQYARERAAADRATAERDTLTAHLADPAWVRGEDPESLRAVAAWRRLTRRLTRGISAFEFHVTDPATIGPLKDAIGALNAEDHARDVEIAAARATNADVLRVARGEPPVPVPASIDLAKLADPDAVARWLVAHAGGYTLTVGYWYDEEEYDETGEKVIDTCHELHRPAGWKLKQDSRSYIPDDAMMRRCARWAVWAGSIEARAVAATDHADAATLRELGVRFLLGEHNAELTAELNAELARWRFVPADVPDVDDADAAPTAAARLAERGIAVPPAPIAVLPYLAWAKRTTLLAAREKDGKSTLVGSAVAALTTGRPWLGQPTTPVTVLWLHEEQEDDVIGRLQQFGADLTRVHLVDLVPIKGEEAARVLAANVARFAPGLVVIDSLIRYAKERITNAQDAMQWERVLTPLSGLARRGAAIIVLHHAGKKDGEFRDSTEIGAFADMLIQMPRGIERGNRQRLDARGRIIGIEPSITTVALDKPQHIHRLAEASGLRQLPAPKAVLGDKDRTGLATLVGTLTYTEWYAASGLRSKKMFGELKERLILAGAVVVTPDGRYRAA